MTFSSCLTDRDSILVLDASVIINLLATGYAGAILQAVPAPIVVTDNVIREIEQGAVNGRPEPKQLSELIQNQTLKREELSGIALEHFFDLVSGSTAARSETEKPRHSRLHIATGSQLSLMKKKQLRFPPNALEH